MPMKEILRLTASDGCKPSSESDQEDVRAQVEGIATLLKASIPPGKDIHGRPSPPSEKPQRDVLVLLAELRQIYGVPQSLIDELAEMDRQFHAAQSATAPLHWTKIAFAYLGYVRDALHPHDVGVVQRFLDGASPDSTSAGKEKE